MVKGNKIRFYEDGLGVVLVSLLNKLATGSPVIAIEYDCT